MPQNQPKNNEWLASESFAPTSAAGETHFVVSRAPLDHLTRGLLIGVGIFGVIVLLLGAWLIKNSIFTPFRVKISDQDKQLASTISTQLADDLKKKDTDGDGLNDYDETYLYGTSIYLADTDSDGVKDDQEVKAGTDPNCRPDENCKSIRLVSPDTKLSDLFPQFTPTDVTLKEKSLKEFRQILIDSGMPAETVNGFDDNFLLSVIEAVVTSDEANTEPQVNEISDADLRKFLIDAGLQKSEVDKLSSDDLRQIISTLE